MLEGHDYYNEHEMLKIKEFLLKNPNRTKTSQYHDYEIFGKPLEKDVGASGRWHG